MNARAMARQWGPVLTARRLLPGRGDVESTPTAHPMQGSTGEGADLCDTLLLDQFDLKTLLQMDSLFVGKTGLSSDGVNLLYLGRRTYRCVFAEKMKPSV